MLVAMFMPESVPLQDARSTRILDFLQWEALRDVSNPINVSACLLVQCARDSYFLNSSEFSDPERNFHENSCNMEMRFSLFILLWRS